MNERHDRYAAAAYEDVNPGFRWEDADPRDQESFRQDVTGVMALADAETASLRATLARVRAAAQKAKASGNAWDLDDLVSVALADEGPAVAADFEIRRQEPTDLCLAYGQDHPLFVVWDLQADRRVPFGNYRDRDRAEARVTRERERRSSRG